MKSIIPILLVLFAVSIVHADILTLNTSENEVTPSVSSIELAEVFIDLEGRNNELTVYYYKLNSEGKRIPDPDTLRTRRLWKCRNYADNPDTPEDESDPCFSDIFLFVVRNADVGTPIGRGLRQLIWNRMKKDLKVVKTKDNDGSFDD